MKSGWKAAPAAGQQRGPQVGVAAAVADVPLARGDDLQRLVAALVEVRLALGRGGLAVEVAAGAQRLDDRPPGAVRRLAGDLLGVQLRPDPVSQSGVSACEPAVAGDQRAGGQLQLAPPRDVGEVAEGAAHRDAGALVHLAPGWASTGSSTPKTGEVTVVPKRRLVPLVVGVGDERHARGQQLGPGRLDVDRASRRGGGTRPGGSAPG
jgi:hypothetical protein